MLIVRDMGIPGTMDIPPIELRQYTDVIFRSVEKQFCRCRFSGCTGAQA